MTSSTIKHTGMLYLQMLRSHQWIKNLLLGAPMLAAHQISHIQDWMILGLAFIAFNCCASALYILNDILDQDADRCHPSKSQRPFASRRVSVRFGILLILILLMLSIGMAVWINNHFLAILLLYILISSLYSWRLKCIALLDCILLAILYMLRMVAGAAALSIPLSFWLLAFTMFLFLSLAFLKRGTELRLNNHNPEHQLARRGYYPSDIQVIQPLGIAAGYAAAVILSFYLNRDDIRQLYPTPEFIWVTVPLLLLWLSWMWLNTHRGTMHDDPILFAIKDKVSLLIAGLTACALILASLV